MAEQENQEEINTTDKKPKRGFYEELDRFLGKSVDIEYMEGQTKKEISGTLVALQNNFLHAILRTDKEKIVIRNVLMLKRARG